jgi:hypothetical protein|tara:strand:+ start:777 stop:1451 length:675 start_codon:yes stop_codon:yes gene_type:complete
LYKFLFKDSAEVFDPIARQKIAEKIYFHEKHWKPLTEYFGSTLFAQPGMEHMYLLGDGLYVLQDRNEINQEVQEILDTEFSELIYTPVLETIKEMFGIGVNEVSYYEDLPLPGFHIYRGNDIGLTTTRPYHTDDNLRFYKPEADRNNIYSFAIPIILPECGACLDWLGDAPDYFSHNYELGVMSMWHGMVKHRLGAKPPAEGDRITLQGHVYVNANDGILKVYF